MSAKKIFSNEQQLAIQQAINTAELNTSGEIRVHIDTKCKGDALDRGVELFSKLKMDKTALRNGVLFYLAVENRKFSIIGDKGINDVVPKGFWDSIRDVMQEHFKEQKFTEGLCKGIEMAGEKLKAHFPYQSDDKDELSNEVSFGN